MQTAMRLSELSGKRIGQLRFQVETDKCRAERLLKHLDADLPPQHLIELVTVYLRNQISECTDVLARDEHDRNTPVVSDRV